MVIELTGMEIANASLLDESTAAAEAMALLFDVRSRDQKKSNVNKFVSEEILPQTYPFYKLVLNLSGRVSYWKSPRV
jgi:glycine dehydrogenase